MNTKRTRIARLTLATLVSLGLTVASAATASAGQISSI